MIIRELIEKIRNKFHKPTAEEIESALETISSEYTVSDENKSEFYQKGNAILRDNGWIQKGISWVHPSFDDFKICEKSGVYEITPTNRKYKILKIVKTENILKRIKEYNVYLTSKKKIILKDSFLSDFE